MKKRVFAVLTILCLLFAAVCLAEEENQVDITLEGYAEAGGKRYVTWTDEADELDGLGLIGTVGQTIGDMLKDSGILSVEPVLEGDVFEGWMESAAKAVETAGKDFEGGSMYALVVNMEAASLTEALVYDICEMLK